ncbi:MAG: Ig-like domain-containing protein [Acidobacteriota bacterium]|nr:Ig-like domain-containing protein [Acidobacteriota bacterium]
MTTSARGRYAQSFPEGAHTIRASANGYTTVWRQIVLPAGAGVIPIDIRLTRRGETKTIASGASSLIHGGDNAVTRRAELTIPAGAVTSGANVTLTSTGAQSLAGLLPLGWSPLASAEIVSSAQSLTASTLTFDIPQIPAGQSLSAVRYDESRDEWRVLTAVVNVANGKASLDVTTPGAYALVYADRRAGLTIPAQATTGAPLLGVTDPCARILNPQSSILNSVPCPSMVAKSFPLDPEVVLPTESTVATLKIDGASPHIFPSGTAVQAYIDEELHLADGGRELDPPFATDLLLYRDLDGNDGEATFNLAPSPRAAEVFLEVGFDHIRILPYPGRLDRGTLIGPEGGRVPGDEKVAVEIPTGATQDALLANASSLTDPTSLGPIAGYTIVGGFQLTLDRANQPAETDIDGDGDIDPIAAVELTRPARVTFSNPQSSILNPQSQLILVEVLDGTPYGQLFRLAAEMTALEGGRWTTKSIDRNVLPIDGVIREGRYLLLAANAPIAFARGIVRVGTGVATRDARITTPGLGVTDLSRVSGIFNIPVPATPAAPFSLVPRIVAAGDGATYTHPSAPAANAVVNVGDLSIVAQPPQVASTIPTNNATNVSLTTTVEATITPGVDPSSITATSITVIDTTNGSVVLGTAAANGGLGIRWTLPAGETLQAGRRYVAAVAATIRGTNGSPLGQTHTFAFTTAASVTNDEVHPERIRITIPDANGVSKVIGTAGALKAGWLAVPVRRGNDFLTRYSVEAAADGSFSVSIGTNERDRISITDSIDLRVLNANGALAAIIPLTPFVSEDGQTFIAPVSESEVRFTSIDGYSLLVPPGAFDKPTIITLRPESGVAFAGVPNLSAELQFHAGVRVEFEGRTKKPLDLELPLPPNFIAGGRRFYLGLLGESIRGPRVAIVDTLRVEGGKFTTRSSTGSNLVMRTESVDPGGVLVGDDAKKYLVKMSNDGIFGSFSATEAFGGFTFFLLETLEWATRAVDLFNSHFQSLYVPDFFVTEGRGRVVMPGLIGTGFTVSGVDSSSGLTLFKTAYNAVTVGETGDVIRINSPSPDMHGPLPVFATPFRVEAVDLHSSITRVRQLKLELTGGNVVVTPTTAGTPEKLGEGARVQLLNASSGLSSFTATADASGSFAPFGMSAQRGDRVLLLVSAIDVEPQSPISVIFNEGIALPSDSGGSDDDDQMFLRAAIKLRQIKPTLVDLTEQTVFLVDSNSRRITLGVAAELVRGATYQVSLTPTLEDSAGNPLARGVVISGSSPTQTGGNVDIDLRFAVREPADQIRAFELEPASGQTGALRDLARYGNLVFVSALEGGLLAYDLSDPAALETDGNGAQPKPVSFVPGQWSDSSGNFVSNGFEQHWAVAADHHGRVFSSGFTSIFGVIRSYRAEDFVRAAETNLCTEFPDAPPNSLCRFHGAAIVSWRPGYGSSLSTSSATLLSDRPEATPRKMQILVQDDEETYDSKAAFTAVYPIANQTSYINDGFARFDAGFAYTPQGASYYLVQRVTVVNQTLRMRWSADIRANDGTQFVTGIIARPGDKLNVLRNLRTYAVVSLFGYGIGVYDLGAIESNDAPNRPTGYKALREQLILTKAEASSASPIPDLAFSPEAAVVPSTDASAIPVYALDARHGALGVAVSLPTATAGASYERSYGLVLKDGQYVHPRLAVIEQTFVAAGHALLARFSSIAYHAGPDDANYMLVAGGDYGLLVISPDLAGTVATDLNESALVDVVWIPGGAWAVRRVEGAPLAVVVDGRGRVLLVDLNRIDESALVTQPDQLFPTALKALATAGTVGEVGADDPRIIWKSDGPLVSGTLPPIYDPRTGTLFGGDLLTKRIRVLTAADPRIVMKADLGRPEGLSEIGSPVPLGAEVSPSLAQQMQASANASLGAFRLEVALPGGVARALESAGRKLTMAIESEPQAGAESEQSWAGLAKSHLRTTRRSGVADARSTEFVFERAMPRAASTAEQQSLDRELRHQEGYNTYLSPWIVAIADPMASEHVALTSAQRAAAGCVRCDRPPALGGKSEAQGVYELFTRGRHIAVRPDGSLSNNIFSGTSYAYLGERNRLVARFATTIGEIGRAKIVRAPAQNPAIAVGMLSDTTYLHSGEVETSHVDLFVPGRAGMDVLIERTYRSRTMGGSLLGQNWDARFFRHLRALPSGDVEYGDGEGELWLFKRSTSVADADETEAAAGAVARYDSPKGLFLKLVRTERGWTMFTQKWEITTFDLLGRRQSESDQFFDPLVQGSGNLIHYIYDDSGRLVEILDSDHRSTSFAYWRDDEAALSGAYPGLLKELKDWRERSVLYEYDSVARLVRVRLPEFARAGGVPQQYSATGTSRPTIEYSYENVAVPSANEPLPSVAVTNFLELAGNLKSIKDPAQFPNGQPRVIFTYDTSNDPLKRDRVIAQTWPCATNVPSCSERTATFARTSPTEVTTTDMLGQERKYELVAQSDGVHVGRMTEVGVPVIESATQGLPAATSPSEPVATRSLTTDFNYNSDGQLTKITSPSGLVTENTYVDASHGAPGKILSLVKEKPSSGAAIETRYDYDTASSNAVATVVEVGRREVGPSSQFVMREAQTPSRDRLSVTSTDEGVKQTETFDARGQLRSERHGNDQIELATLGAAAPAVQPLSWIATPGVAHGIAEKKNYLGTLDPNATPFSVQSFVFSGGRRNSDGEWTTAYDARGRVTSMSSATEGRKIDFVYDPNDRIGQHSRRPNGDELDGLGRVAVTERRAGTESTATLFAYDVHASDEGSIASDKWTRRVARCVVVVDRGVGGEVRMNQLRAKGWGTTVAARPPTWAQTLFGVTFNDSSPVSKRESVSNLEVAFTYASASQPDGTSLYVLHDLYLAASTESVSKLNLDFHLLPYREPANGLIFARARWLDPATHTFTTPDPNGYGCAVVKELDVL